jgi:hypothetical protein
MTLKKAVPLLFGIPCIKGASVATLVDFLEVSFSRT